MILNNINIKNNSIYLELFFDSQLDCTVAIIDRFSPILWRSDESKFWSSMDKSLAIKIERSDEKITKL